MIRPMLDLRADFSHFLGAEPERLHFAAHSHHPWPDATRAAQIEAWEMAARLQDGKWERILGPLWEEARRRVAGVLELPDPATLCFAPNTHEFALRILSALPERPRVLTTTGEFHSFSRQVARLEEDGLVRVMRVPAEPGAEVPARLAEAARAGAVRPRLGVAGLLQLGLRARRGGARRGGGRRRGAGDRRLSRLHGGADEPRRHGGPRLLPGGRLQIRHGGRGRVLPPRAAGLAAAPAQHRLVRGLRRPVGAAIRRRALSARRDALHGRDLRSFRPVPARGGAALVGGARRVGRRISTGTRTPCRRASSRDWRARGSTPGGWSCRSRRRGAATSCASTWTTPRPGRRSWRRGRW